MKNWEFHRELHSRGLTHAKLAERAGLKRALVSKAIAGLPGGFSVRQKIAPWLTVKERRLLSWFDTETCSTGNIVPHHD